MAVDESVNSGCQTNLKVIHMGTLSSDAYKSEVGITYERHPSFGSVVGTYTT